MNVFKLILCDVREGILKNKRYIIIPLLSLFECMYADINLFRYKIYTNSKNPASLLDLLSEMFHGCDPITKTPDPNVVIELPYFWISVFVFSIFIGFDYMHNDLTQFGIQVLSRSRKRRMWWLSKCIWCILSGLWFYILYFGTILIYSFISGITINLDNNKEIFRCICDRSIVYFFNNIPDLSMSQKITLLLAPLAVICTLNMIQMLLCLFIKPMYSYMISIGLLMLGVLTDSPVAFSRSAMLTMNSWLMEKGYPLVTGLIICGLITLVSVTVGTLYFKRYNILPDKE